MNEADEYDKNQHFSLVPFAKRVFIPDLKLRKILKDYCLNGLSANAFKILNLIRSRELINFIFHANCVIDEVYLIDPKYPNAKLIIELLSRSEPITGLIQFSLLNISEMTAVMQLSHGSSIDSILLTNIYNKVIILKTFFNSFTTTEGVITCKYTLDPIVSGLLNIVLLRIEELNTNTTTRNLVKTTVNNSFMKYFPAIPTQYK